MFKPIRTMLILIGLLPHTFAQADSTISRDWSRDLRTTVSDTMLVPAFDSSSQLRSSYSRFDKLNFQDSSAVGRASKLRSLSLLTLAEFKKSRLFLGVNKRGLLGLHFNSAKQGDDRCLEVARMPYLRKTTSE